MEDETMDDILTQIKFHGTKDELDSALENLENILDKTHKVEIGFYGEIVELKKRLFETPTRLGSRQDYTINLYLLRDAHVYTRKCNMAVDGAPLYGIIKTFNAFVDTLDFSKIEVEWMKEVLKIYAKDKHNPLLRERFDFVVFEHDDHFRLCNNRLSECIRYCLITSSLLTSKIMRPYKIENHLLVKKGH